MIEIVGSTILRLLMNAGSVQHTHSLRFCNCKEKSRSEAGHLNIYPSDLNFVCMLGSWSSFVYFLCCFVYLKPGIWMNSDFVCVCLHTHKKMLKVNLYPGVPSSYFQIA